MRRLIEAIKRLTRKQRTLAIGVIAALVFALPVAAQNIVTSSGVWYRSGSAMLLNPSTLSIGSSSSRIAKGWFTDLDATTATISSFTSGDLTVSDTSPSVLFQDTDATAGDDNATIDVACTDVGSGTEDCDVTFTQQIAGVATAFLTADADGNMTIGKQIDLNSNDVTGTGNLTVTGTLSLDGGVTTISSAEIALLDGLTAVSGADLTIVTGTAGTSGDLAIWNVDGDLVDGPTPPSGAIVGTTDIQTLTNKTVSFTDNTVTMTAAELNTAVSDDTVALQSDNLSVFASTTSAQLASIISDETGTGALVLANSPTLVTPDIGAGTGTSLVLTGNLSAEDLLIEDFDASHYLTITTTSDLTLARTLTIVPGDASRTLTLTGDATLDQDVSSSGNPQFTTIELGHASDTTLARSGIGAVTIEGNRILTTADEGTGNGLDADTVDGIEASAFLQNILEDTTPQLGGNLDLNSSDITGTGNITITGNLSTDGGLTTIGSAELNLLDGLTALSGLDGILITGTAGTSGNIVQWNADGDVVDSTVAVSLVSSALQNIVEDTTPQLGGNLDLNGSNITGTGDINITGDITISADTTLSGALYSNPVKTDITSYTVSATDTEILANCGCAQTINLPAAASSSGRILMVKDIDGDAQTNNVTIDGNAAETIDGVATYLLESDYQAVSLISDGTAWYAY